jgi:hypothetical protein
MPTRNQVHATVALAAVVWAVLLTVQGVTLRPGYVKPYSLAVAVVVVIFEVFDHWAWRWGPIPRVVGRPLLRGTWRGVVASTWIDPTTGQTVDPREAFLVVRQTYSTISTRLLTKESKSQSLAASIDAPRGDAAAVHWTYLNRPRLPLQGRSRIHHGAAVLEVHGSPPARLTGWYWTDRNTTGELTFTARSAKLHTDFLEASADPERATADGSQAA